MSNRERICRLCLKNDNFSLHIFSNCAKEKNIQSNIEEYLHIHINRGDNLTKYICYQCLNKLDLMEKFVKTSKQSQILLRDNNNSAESLFHEDSIQTPSNVELNQQQNKVDEKDRCRNIAKRKPTDDISKGLIKDSNTKKKPPQNSGLIPTNIFNNTTTETEVFNINTITEEKSLKERKRMLTDYYNKRCKIPKYI